jgi:hypothetical protein
MVNSMHWLSLTHMRPRGSFVAHSHAMPISTTVFEASCFVGVNTQILHAVAGGSSVPISRGSPPLYRR